MLFLLLEPPGVLVGNIIRASVGNLLAGSENRRRYPLSIDRTGLTRGATKWAFPLEAQDPVKVSRLTFNLTPLGPDTKLKVTHSELELASEVRRGIEDGWPAVFSSLKKLLETATRSPTSNGNPSPKPERTALAWVTFTLTTADILLGYS